MTPEQHLAQKIKECNDKAKAIIVERACKASTLVEAIKIARNESYRAAKVAEVVIDVNDLLVDFPQAVSDTFEIVTKVVEFYEAKKSEISLAV